jgi:ABC-type Na+ efflux pump permease subunit
MTFLPIVDRELRAAARRRRTYRLRLWAAGLACFVVAWFLMISLPLPLPQAAGFGKGLFLWLSWGVLAFCVFEGARSTSDCLSGEKREGTLGLLFLTDLRGHDVVLGKFVSAALRTLYSLLAVFPILGLTLTMGGVTGGEFWRVALALVVLMFFSLATGLFVSALSEDSRRALVGTLLLLAVSWLGPIALSNLLTLVEPLHYQGQVAWASPLFAFPAAFADAYFGPRAAGYWVSVGVGLAFGGLFLRLAAWRVGTSWQGFRRLTWPARWRERWERWNFGDAATRVQQRRRWLGVNPAYWLARRRSGRRLVTWLLLGVATVAWIALWWIDVAQGNPQGAAAGAGAAFTFAICWGMKLAVAAHAAQTFADARRNGAFELLLSTPLAAHEILRGHALAVRSVWLGPAVAALLLVFGIAVSATVVDLSWGTLPLTVFTAVAQLTYEPLKFACDLLAVYWVASWLSLKHGRANEATIKAILYTQVLPFILFCVPRVIPDLIFVAWARDQLRYHFRSTVEKPLEERADWVWPTAARRPAPVPPVMVRAAGGVEPLNR